MDIPQRTENLGGGVELRVSREHTFGTDALLLAEFAAPKRRERCADLCSGCGIIPFLWMAKQPPDEPVKAVDIQPEAVRLMRESVRLSGLEGRFLPVLGDLREPEALGHAAYDLVSCNPPYKAAGTGVMSRSESDGVARHETMCTIDDVCRSAAYLLRFGGRLCLCQLPERLVDVLTAMRAHKIEPKRLRFVQQRGDSAPWLFLVEGKRGSKPFLQLEPPVIIEKSNPEFGENCL